MTDLGKTLLKTDLDSMYDTLIAAGEREFRKQKEWGFLFGFFPVERLDRKKLSGCLRNKRDCGAGSLPS